MPDILRTTSGISRNEAKTVAAIQSEPTQSKRGCA